MIFTQNQVQELLDIVEKYHLFFIGSSLGKQFLSSEDKKRLESYGFNIDDIYSETNDQILTAFKFGVLSDALSKKEATGIDYEDLKRYIRRGEFVPLNRRERATVDSIKFQSLSDISKNRNKIFEDVNQIISTENIDRRAAQEEIIRDEAIRTVENRKSVREMVSNLGHKTGDWSRNFGRISEYILHQAFDEGRAALYERKGGEDVLVYKDVYPGACKHCVKAYLTGDVGSEPKIFKLSELRENGTNIGRKAKDWKPVIGNMHPWCRCTLNYLKPGTKWDDKKKDFVVDKNYKPKIKNRPKVKVEYNGKVLFV